MPTNFHDWHAIPLRVDGDNVPATLTSSDSNSNEFVFQYHYGSRSKKCSTVGKIGYEIAPPQMWGRKPVYDKSMPLHFFELINQLFFWDTPTEHRGETLVPSHGIPIAQFFRFVKRENKKNKIFISGIPEMLSLASTPLFLLTKDGL